MVLFHPKATVHYALCTSHFFLFDLRRDRIVPGYLQAIFTANYLESQLGSEAKGTTGYAAVRPRHLLAARIPLPGLDEQRRIVACIEELSAKVHETKELRVQSNSEVEAFLMKVLSQIFEKLMDHVTTIGNTFRVTTGGTPRVMFLSIGEET